MIIHVLSVINENKNEKIQSCLKFFTDAQSARTSHGMSVPKENKATETQLTITANRIFLSFFCVATFWV